MELESLVKKKNNLWKLLICGVVFWLVPDNHSCAMYIWTLDKSVSLCTSVFVYYTNANLNAYTRLLRVVTCIRSMQCPLAGQVDNQWAPSGNFPIFVTMIQCFLSFQPRLLPVCTDYGIKQYPKISFVPPLKACRVHHVTNEASEWLISLDVSSRILVLI